MATASDICVASVFALLVGFIHNVTTKEQIETNFEVYSLSIPDSMHEDSLVLTLGCEKDHLQLQILPTGGPESEFFYYFYLLENGQLFTKSSLFHLTNATFSFEVSSSKNCYSNIPRKRVFILKVIPKFQSLIFLKESYSGYFLRDTCVACPVIGMDEIVIKDEESKENKNLIEYKLFGQNSDYFQLVSRGSSVRLLLEEELPENLPTLADDTFKYVFILEACVKNSKCGFTNIEIRTGTARERDQYLYMPLEDDSSEGNFVEVPSKIEENHDRFRRQTSSTLERMEVSVYENTTGVLFSISGGNHGWGQYVYHIKLATPSNIFQVDQGGNVYLKNDSYLDYDSGPRQYHIHIERISYGGGTKGQHCPPIQDL